MNIQYMCVLCVWLTHTAVWDRKRSGTGGKRRVKVSMWLDAGITMHEFKT